MKYDPKEHGMLRVIDFVVIKALLVVTCTIISLTCYIVTIRRFNKIKTVFINQENFKLQRLLLYPAVLFGSFLPVLIYEFLRLCIGFEKLTIFKAAIMIVTHSIGWVNALVYGLHRKLYGRSPSNLQELSNMTSQEIPLSWDNVKTKFEIKLIS